MTGSSIDLIVIPIVASVSLAAWLIVVFYADSHPQWHGDRTEGRQRIPEGPPELSRADNQLHGPPAGQQHDRPRN
jgi:hypothetical protein